MDKNLKLRPALNILKDKSNIVGAEIGVGGGANALSILELLDIKRLYLIDQYLPYRGLKYHGVWPENTNPKEIKENAIKYLAQYNDKIVWIFKLSEDAVNDIDELLDFVYIDGNHRYEYVKKDIELYLPIIKKGGLICGHDFKHEGGVTQAVREMFTDFGFSEWDWWKKI